MDNIEFQREIITKKFGIDLSQLRPIFSFIDFGNVNYWFEKDRQNNDGSFLPNDKKIFIDVEKLYNFSNLFSMSSRFYYGVNVRNRKSIGFIDIARRFFGKYRVITKPIQKIRHYIEGDNLVKNASILNYDTQGPFVYINKCNFDVEICVDAIRLLEQYKTFCLFSADADFTRLCEYLKKHGKKVIIIKGGFAQSHLLNTADIKINAQEIKQYITQIKAKI